MCTSARGGQDTWMNGVYTKRTRQRREQQLCSTQQTTFPIKLPFSIMKIIGLISPRHQPCCQKASDEYFSVYHVPFSWSLPPTLPSPFLPSLSSALLPYFSHPSSLLPSFSFLTSLEDDLHIYFSSFLPDTIFVSYLSKSSLGCICRSFFVIRKFLEKVEYGFLSLSPTDLFMRSTYHICCLPLD